MLESVCSNDFFVGLPRFSNSELGRLSIEILLISGEPNTESDLLVCYIEMKKKLSFDMKINKYKLFIKIVFSNTGVFPTFLTMNR